MADNLHLGDCVSCDGRKVPMTADEFKERTGREPQADDLDRVNCPIVGNVGHVSCGWCVVCNAPAFQCLRYHPTTATDLIDAGLTPRRCNSESHFWPYPNDGACQCGAVHEPENARPSVNASFHDQMAYNARALAALTPSAPRIMITDTEIHVETLPLADPFQFLEAPYERAAHALLNAVGDMDAAIWTAPTKEDVLNVVDTIESAILALTAQAEAAKVIAEKLS